MDSCLAASDKVLISCFTYSEPGDGPARYKTQDNELHLVFVYTKKSGNHKIVNIIKNNKHI